MRIFKVVLLSTIAFVINNSFCLAQIEAKNAPIDQKNLLQDSSIQIIKSNGEKGILKVQSVNHGIFTNKRVGCDGKRHLSDSSLQKPILVVNQRIVNIDTLNQIDPSCIKKVEILKTLASTALYGPDGVNGAIIITLKDCANNTNKPITATPAIKKAIQSIVNDNSINPIVVINGSEFSNKEVLSKVLPNQIASLQLEQHQGNQLLVIKLKPYTQFML
jgi:hypothetical protein